MADLARKAGIRQIPIAHNDEVDSERRVDDQRANISRIKRNTICIKIYKNGSQVGVMIELTKTRRKISETDGLPGPSSSVFSDIRRFVLHKPAIPTFIEAKSDALREDYEHRIRQRLDLSVSEYAIMNIHKIGIAAPGGYVFDELLGGQAVRRCWPGHMATLERVNGNFEYQHVYLLGRKKRFLGLKYDLFGLNTIPLFTMKAIKVQRFPEPSDFDSPRYILYDCSGGYPVGVFCCFVRSSIDELGEIDESQVFMAVVFNFYGRKDWPEHHIVNATWERIHNRVTANILNRFKRLCEVKFQKDLRQ